MKHLYISVLTELTQLGFPGGSDGKESAHNVEDPGLMPGSGRSLGEVNGNPLQYSCLKNPMDGEVWRAAVHGVARVRYDLATELPSGQFA